ncbi:hypothetical protein JHW46_24360, partial [Vibrio splendidus]|nr:hypothetical protein [Vibrio splendidus]
RENFRDELGEISEACDIVSVGDSSAMNNISGYVGASQMPHLDVLLRQQRDNAERWDKYFENDPCVRILKKRPGISPSYWAFTIL